MNEDTVRLTMIGLLLRKRWRLLLVFAAAGAVIGLGASVLFSPGYETSANVLLQGPRDPDQLVTETQLAMSSPVLDRAARTLGWGVSGTDLEHDVTATVAEGNIIEITGSANSPERAQRLADQVAQEYVTYSTQLASNTTDASAQLAQEQEQTLRQAVTDTNRRISELHASAGQGNTIDSVGVRTELESLRSQLSQAMAKVDEMDATVGSAKMVVMGPAEKPTGPAAPTRTHFVAGGAGAGVLLGLIGLLFAARIDQRLRGEDQIAAAAGATVLGGIEVPDDPPAGDDADLGTRLRRLVVDGRPWYVPDVPAVTDEDGLDIRYHRVLSRLRECTGEPARVLAVVADDDPAANRVAKRLADTVASSGPAGGLGRIGLRTVAVAAERPTVPDADTTSGALLVVSAGARTAWELVGLTEACADAGHEVLGVVVAHRTRSEPERPLDGSPAETVLAGSA